MINTTGKRRRKESGMAVLQLVLLLVMVGGLLLPPLLSLMITGMKAGQMEERKTKQFYAADAGMSAALWRIQNQQLPTVPKDLNDPYWDEAFYTSAYANYTLSNMGASDNINANGVVYHIGPKWVLQDIETPPTIQQRTPPPDPIAISVSGFQTIGNPNGHGKYKIIIKYNDSAGTLGISRIGCWLPAGYEYWPGSSSLERTQNPVQPYYKVPVVTPFRGGHYITWNYSPPLAYNLFEPAGSQREVTFEFTPDRKTQSDFCWFSDNLTASAKMNLVWTNMKLFDIQSWATDSSGQSTTVTALSNRNDATPDQEGDYYAFGSTLMRDSTPGVGNNYRDRLYDNTTVTINDMPAGARIVQILLYWSGWKCKPYDVTGSGYTNAYFTSLVSTDNLTKVELKINSYGFPAFSDNITAGASKIQGVGHGADWGWSYSCIADITAAVQARMGANFTGNGTYLVGHCDAGPWSASRKYPLYNWVSGHPTTGANAEKVISYTAAPLGSPTGGSLNNPGTDEGSVNASNVSTCSGCVANDRAYSGWSIVIVYTSPYTRGHQIYISDNLTFTQPISTTYVPIAGFTVPELISGENAAKYTHFVGEGDLKSGSSYADSVSVNGTTSGFQGLWDAYNPVDDVCNNLSVIPPFSTTTIPDIDIDTFNYPAGVIKAGDTKSTVRFITNGDGLNIIYMVMSFRSKLDTGGANIYYIQ